MSTIELVAKMTGALSIILGLLFLVVYLLRRFGLVAQAGAKGVIEVVENRAILPKRYISLVRVADNYLVIGSTEQGITLLGSINEENFCGFEQILSKEIHRDNEMEVKP